MLSFLLLIRSFARALYHAFKEQPAIRGLIILTFIVLAVGTLFYTSVEHWSVLDSLYFSVTTLTTVGYGDLSPHKSAAKIFTIIYILLGVSILLGLVNLLAEHAIRVQQERRQHDKMMARRKHSSQVSAGVFAGRSHPQSRDR